MRETFCENAKLRAADSYVSCLIRVVSKAKVRGHDPSEEAIARCDEGFDRAFWQAEAGGACRTPGGASNLREPIKAQVFRTADTLSNVANCTETPGETAVCVLSNTTTAVDLEGLVS